jgi:hypothetical protein
LDHRLVQALDHPLRVNFLRLLAERGVLSPAEALDLFDVDGVKVGNVAYHAKVLHLLELVERATDSARGDGFGFRVTRSGVLALNVLGFSRKEGDSD